MAVVKVAHAVGEPEVSVASTAVVVKADWVQRLAPRAALEVESMVMHLAAVVHLAAMRQS